MFQFLIHEQKDSVGVTVIDIKANGKVKGQTLDGQFTTEVKALMDIPLGHKIALKDFKKGDTVIKYGCDIGTVVAAIKTGEHVHIHNLKTKRW